MFQCDDLFIIIYLTIICSFAEASLYTINDFVFSTNIDNLNLFKVRDILIQMFLTHHGGFRYEITAKRYFIFKDIECFCHLRHIFDHCL